MPRSDRPADGQDDPIGRPAWRRRTEGEQRWWVASVIAVAIALQTAVPERFALHPRYLLQAIEAVTLVVAVIIHPRRLSRRSQAARVVTLLLSALMATTNAASVVLLVRAITASHNSVSASDLLTGGAEIWLTNIVVFSLWFWEYDRGGPAARALGRSSVPDLLFPQMSDGTLDADWEPRYLDYLFVSYTNSTAFSPTDTLPLSHGAKGLFMVQSAISLVTVLLIAARAVNILPS